MNKWYAFNRDDLMNVLEHLHTYKIFVLEMIVNEDGNEYKARLDSDAFPEGEYQHLLDHYNFREIVV